MPAGMALFKALAFSSLLAKATAHIVMAHPVPFTAEYMATSPLDSSGSNFPCQYKDSSSYDYVTMNNLAVGTDIPLTFNGSASHGGGSCQIAISNSAKPDKSSVWKNIMVFQGGCPTTGSGNDGTGSYTFQIPDKFPNGVYTLGWVWNNLIGNREIYMSCAPITVTGGSSDKSFYDTLPDLYVVNMPPSSCSIAEGKNLIIPDTAGISVSTFAGAAFASATGPSCPAATGGSGSATSGGSAGTSAASSAAGGASGGASAAAPTSNAAGTGAGSAPTSTATDDMGSSAAGGSSGVYPLPTHGPSGAAAGASSAPITMSTLSTGTSQATSVPDAIIPTTTAAAATSGTGGSAAGTAAGTGAGVEAGTQTGAAAPSGTGNSTGSSSSSSVCTSANDGALVCNGPTQFGLCNGGSVVWQAVAAGTTCENGQIAKRDVVWHHPRWFGKRHV